MESFFEFEYDHKRRVCESDVNNRDDQHDIVSTIFSEDSNNFTNEVFIHYEDKERDELITIENKERTENNKTNNNESTSLVVNYDSDSRSETPPIIIIHSRETFPENKNKETSDSSEDVVDLTVLVDNTDNMNDKGLPVIVIETASDS